MLQELVPCIVCEKAVVYYAKTTGTLAAATYIAIHPTYPSNFDGNLYNGIICDQCLDNAIQSKRLLANI